MLDLSLDGRVFRVNPEFSLVAADRLPKRMKGGDLVEGQFGLFVPKSGQDKGARSFPATTEAALLHLSLRRPSVLPFHLRSQMDVPMSDRVGQLLLSGILDVEYDGEFVTGFRAIRALEASGRSRADGRFASSTTALSDAALAYGYRHVQIWIDDSIEPGAAQGVIRRLYQFNTVPPSLPLRNRLSTEQAILEYVDIEELRRIKSESTGSEWKFHQSDVTEWWHFWQPAHRAAQENLVESARLRTWSGDAKLYISPTIADLPETLRICLPILAGSNANAFKMGKNIYGISRPDKAVAYFAHPDDLLETAAILTEALKGIAAQGVPFTSDLSGDGLLSWGSDSPAEVGGERLFATSWRAWIAEVLGTALLTAGRRDYPPSDAIEYAKTTAELAGIDTTDWRPKAHLLRTTS